MYLGINIIVSALHSTASAIGTKLTNRKKTI